MTTLSILTILSTVTDYSEWFRYWEHRCWIRILRM